MSFFDGLFGGGVSEASKQQQQQSENFIREMANAGAGAATTLFPLGQQATQQGYQGAFDLIAQGIPQQLSAFQQGNMGAQDFTNQAGQNAQNAILGLPTAQYAPSGQYSPMGINVDTSYLQNAKIPQYASPQGGAAVSGGNYGGGNFIGEGQPTGDGGMSFGTGAGKAVGTGLGILAAAEGAKMLGFGGGASGIISGIGGALGIGGGAAAPAGALASGAVPVGAVTMTPLAAPVATSAAAASSAAPALNAFGTTAGGAAMGLASMAGILGMGAFGMPSGAETVRIAEEARQQRIMEPILAQLEANDPTPAGMTRYEYLMSKNSSPQIDRYGYDQYGIGNADMEGNS